MTARSRRAAWATALLLCLAMPAAPQEVPGLGATDTRQVVPADRAPWNAVGEVEAAGNHCTGVLTGARIVATAQHCLIDATGRALVPAHEVTFRLGGRMARAVAIQAGQGFDLAQETPWRSDWALLTLDTPLGEGRALRLAREPPREGTPLVLPGWQHDRPGALVADLRCRVVAMGTFGPQGMLVGHNCAGTMGSSGAPLIARAANGTYVVVGVQAKAALGRALGVAVPGFAIPQR